MTEVSAMSSPDSVYLLKLDVKDPNGMRGCDARGSSWKRAFS